VIEPIRARLSSYRPAELNSDGRSRAAVLVPLYTHAGELHVVLTKRTDKVEHHKGEICFPGGAIDGTDLDEQTTALRESDEEIGLHQDHVRIIGRLDDIVTVSDFHVTVLVGEIDPSSSPYRWRPQGSEVEEVLEVPLPRLLDPANQVEVPRMRNGELVLTEAFQFGDHLIWGATARMLRNFLDVAVPATVAPT
jgi:8-oxo-dGTP pyrophosphatase MutT (NUDIX family)